MFSNGNTRNNGIFFFENVFDALNGDEKLNYFECRIIGSTQHVNTPVKQRLSYLAQCVFWRLVAQISCTLKCSPGWFLLRFDQKVDLSIDIKSVLANAKCLFMIMSPASSLHRMPIVKMKQKTNLNLHVKAILNVILVHYN